MKLKAIAPPFTLLTFLSLVLLNSSLLSEPWSIYHQAVAEAGEKVIGPSANDVTMRTLEFRDVPPGSQMDVFQAMRDFHANRLEWTYIDFDERNREAVARVKDMGRMFGGAGSASLHGSIVHFPPQPKAMHMLDLDGNMIVQPHMRAWKERRGIGDTSNPDYYEHHLAYWKKIIDWGADSLHRDEPESPVFAAERYGGGFSPTGIAGFRKWLGENLSSAELAELGIQSLAGFDYAEHLRAKGAPVGDAFRTFDDPLKVHWVAYWQDLTTDFWNRMIRDIKAYADNPNLTLSCNNSSLQMWAPYHREFDFAISELLLETAHPVHLWERSRLAREVGKLQVFGPPKTRAQPVPVEMKNRLLRRVFATAYACGMIGKIPWDVFDQSPDGHARYFAEPEVIADLSAFVRAQDWSGFREATAFGPGIDSVGPARPEVRNGSGGVYGFVRAPVSGEGELLVHLVDWGLPQKAPGAGGWFVTPTGERIRMRDPSENISRTQSEAFVLVFPEAVFHQPEDLLFELLTPANYDPAVHVLAEETGDFGALMRYQGVPVSRKNGEIILQIPALDPWGILRIRSASSMGGLMSSVQKDSLGLLGEARWVVLGDSISQSGRYHRYLETFLWTRFPECELLIFNKGIGGDTAAGGVKRLDWNVFASRPTVVSVKYGMNDVRRNLYFTRDPPGSNLDSREEHLEAYQQNLRSLVEGIEERGARVILVTPSPADDTLLSEPMVEYEVNEGLARAATFVLALAAEKNIPVVDIFKPMQALNLTLQKEDPSATLVGRDRVHPGVEGHFLMAYLWLQQMFGAVTVSNIVIDAESESVVVAAGGRVNSLEASADALSFEWRAESLPFPVPEGAGALAERLGFDELFNREILSLRGLSKGQYRLYVDGNPLHTATAAEWSAGVNLANIDAITPQMKQALAVAAMLERKQDIQQTLADIAFCELRLWGERPHPVNLEEMRILLSEAEERELQKSSPHPAILRRYRQYESLKTEEKELRQSAIRLSQEARDLALPVVRKFVVEKVDEQSNLNIMECEGEKGAIWLCAGQSNMAFPVASAADRDTILEQLKGAAVYAGGPSEWERITDASAPALSAVGVSFGACLSRMLERPVAISVAAVGGTAIDAWLPLEDFPDTDEARRMVEIVNKPEVLAAAVEDAKDFRPWGQHRLAKWGLGRAVPSLLFEKHIRPLQDIPFDGVLWYQGESNANSVAQAGEYEVWLRALIKSYRDFFNQPALPFLIVQLPHFRPDDLEMREGWSIVRDSQRRVAETTAGVYLVDITDQGEADDIHPARKSVVGERAAIAFKFR